MPVDSREPGPPRWLALVGPKRLTRALLGLSGVLFWSGALMVLSAIFVPVVFVGRSRREQTGAELLGIDWVIQSPWLTTIALLVCGVVVLAVSIGVSILRERIARTYLGE